MSNSSLSTQREVALIQSLQHAARQRAAEETRLTEEYAQQVRAVEKTCDEGLAASERVHAEQVDRLQRAFDQARHDADSACAAGERAAQELLDRAQQQSAERRRAALAAAETQAEEARFQALGVFDASKDQPQQQLTAAGQRLRQAAAQLEALVRDLQTVAADRGLSGRVAAPSSALADSPVEATWNEAVGQAERRLAELRDGVVALAEHRLGAWFLGRGRQVGWVLGAVAAAALPAGLATGWQAVPWLAATLGGGGAVGGALVGWAAPRAKRHFVARWDELGALADEIRQSLRSAKHAAKVESHALAQRIVAQRDADVAAAAETLNSTRARLDADHAAECARLQAEHAARLAELKTARDAALAAAEARYPPLLAQETDQRAARDEALRGRRETDLVAAAATRDGDFAACAEAWLGQFDQIATELEALRRDAAQWFPAWDDAEALARIPAEPPAALALGGAWLPLSAIKHGIPEDPRLRPPVDRLWLPALMTFAEQPRLILTAREEGRAAAVEALRTAVLRLLTALPDGKFRATLIDAAGLGENFAGFMHLNDFDEQILGGRIWTDAKQIENRLGLLSDHMEKVLQKYLRDEFATIHEYNAHAGEVAEPYHVVAVANFPAGFSEAAARRLTTIAASGPRCGVYVLASVDDQLRLPHEFSLAELYRDGVRLDWNEGRFVGRHPLFEKLALELDLPPQRDRFIELLREAGQASREASKVEVPFAMAAPPSERIWTYDSGGEIAAPIGRAGAREMQSLRLGRGTSQHVLISGKTGSGKSSLLHALITNLALHYAPDQLEFYLIDFKKGVEFKSYAAGRLPHARVIAIESEREFGVSVLQRLDDELKRRGEAFRTLGVQDLAGFRAADPATPMPRTLLVVDEFQELFVTDDRLAQEAALLLDRLVRQGRAFGVHVLLGSQTLAGAYSLARSTIGQMAVRIALECSEADAHLILSDDNTAARLLSRPGEAIYNDQNGLVAGNHPFQVVWLSDAQRQRYLAELQDRPFRAPTDAPTIVFEGNVAADPRRNEALAELLERSADVAEPTLWLGSAVRIEPDTHVTLRRQGGHNLGIVGSAEESAIGVLTAAAAAIVAQQPRAQIDVLDGARPESAFRDAWSEFAERRAPHVRRSAPREAPRVIEELAAEVAARSADPAADAAPRYLIVHDLAQIRDLRLTEDDFSFSFSQSSATKSAPTDKRFREILREGPAVGVHVLFWCESYNSLMRALDRLALREIEFRVALPMSAADSTSWIDSPLAGQLGEHRAIFYRDDLGTQTKFRPYARLQDLAAPAA